MEKFYLGMDIGTNSVGMACTDETYRLLRAKGRDLWAVRLFDEAKTAEERRAARTLRRRYQRRRQRIEWLQAIFAPLMEGDPLFFMRLNQSALWADDKSEGLGKYALFEDKDYTDVDFYRAYPTIFHLRKALAEGGKAYDLRLYYLALHHIVKYRGHFLREGQSLGEVRSFDAPYAAVVEALAEREEEGRTLDPLAGEAFKEIGLDKRRGKTQKKKEAIALLGAVGEAQKEAVALMLGSKGSPFKLFGDERYREEKSFSFDEIKQEEFDALAATYGDDFELLEKLKAVHDYFVFESILGSHRRISDAMIAIYDKHKRDLAVLKKAIKTHLGEDAYRKILEASDQTANYANYVGHTAMGKEKQTVKKCKPEDFFKFLKKELAPLKGCEEPEVALMLGELEEGKFLPKILHADNGLFPYQVNEEELKEIVTNLIKQYPAFGAEGDDGVTPAQKIASILTYRIPYYVGPLNTAHEGKGGNAWAVRKPGAITPWNFDQMVDRAASNEKFMRRMTSKCSYLHGKDVLPKHSILYQKFNVLNQINKLTIDGKPIDVNFKQQLYTDVYLKVRKVSAKTIRNYLKEKGLMTPAEADAAKIGGTEESFSASMSSYLILKDILGDAVDRVPDLAEDLILWHTLNTDKKIVRRLIERKYGELEVVRANLKKLGALGGFKDFGRLSREFLSELSGGEDPETGEPYTIIGELYATNMNLNEILFDERYGFRRAIEAENGGGIDRLSYEDVEDLYVSPKVRRGVWQALQMADEYIAAVGRAPDKVFVEVTRGDDNKKERTQSRLKQLQALYQDVKEYDDLKHSLKDESEVRLKQERLYLYYRQCGRCMYSGEEIRLEELGSSLYDVDHIIPRTLVKDDSIENKVLVRKEINNHVKGDRYPLPEGCRGAKVQALWKYLHEKKLIGDKKYALLTRVAELGEEDFRSFISRQIVETGQTAKAVAELMRRRYEQEGTKVVYSKASNVSDFRDRAKLGKCREVNDLHHARDAYLNIVVGNVFDVRFGNPRAYFYDRKDGSQRRYNLLKLYDADIPGAWSKEKTYPEVKRNYDKNSMIVTRYTYCQKGAFYDQTVYPKTDGGITASRKEKGPLADASRYGGYKGTPTAYFAIVRSEGKKGKELVTIEAIPVLAARRIGEDPVKLTAYLAENGLLNPTVVVPKVKIKSLMTIDGYPLRIAGVTGNNIIYHNAYQWCPDGETARIVGEMVRLAEWRKQGRAFEEKDGALRIVRNRLGDVSQVTGAECLAVYDAILAHLNRGVCRRLSAARGVAQYLGEGRERFVSLSVADRMTVVLQTVRFLKCNAELCDLSLLGYGAHCGMIRYNKSIGDQVIELIHRSPCGLREVRRRV